MINEVGVNPKFLDISQLGSLGMATKIAYCSNITTEYRQADKRPFLRLALVDVNGRAITGYWWDADQVQQAKFQWAIGHLVEIECQPEFSTSLAVTAITELDSSLNEVEILQEQFRSRLANLDQKVKTLESLLNQFCGASPTHSALCQRLGRSNAVSEIKFSRNPDICEGMVGGRVVLLTGLATALAYTSELYSLTKAEARNALVSAYLYEYLCAKHQPMTVKADAMWKIGAIGTLSEITAAVEPGVDEDIITVVVNQVLELLGVSECATKGGNTVKRLRNEMIALSKLGYQLSSQVGDVGAVVDGITFVG